MKTPNTSAKWPAGLSPTLKADFKALEKRVFHENPKTGFLTIGGAAIDPQLREVLREEADYIMRTNFFEVFDATIVNEAAAMALLQSANFNHVEIAKMLHHLNFVFKNMVLKLAKPK